jgi:hypothetical protein
MSSPRLLDATPRSAIKKFAPATPGREKRRYNPRM